MASPPTSVSSARKRAANRRNILVRYHGEDSPEVADAERNLRYVTLRELAENTVSGWPPLTAAQRADLAALLRGADPSTVEPDTEAVAA